MKTSIKPIILSSALCTCFLGCILLKSNIQQAKATNLNIITTFEGLQNALNKQTKDIVVGDIDLEGKRISLNYDVSISSNDKSSTIKNGYVSILGPNSSGNSISITINNIHFDGGFDKSVFDLNQSLSFEEIFGSSRENNKCIDGSFGYYNLTLNDCLISNYASSYGAAIFVDNSLFGDDKVITLNNCKFFNNVSEFNTLHFGNNKQIISMSNCEFYSNYAYKGAGFNIANGSSIIDKVNVHDNIFVPYDADQKNYQMCGGGAFVGGSNVKMTNSYFTNNESIWGGGLAVTSAMMGTNNVILENIVVKNNKAKYGGGLYIASLSGQPITFINSEVLLNKSELGGPIFTEVYAKHSKMNNGGLVEFFFSTFGMNSSNDKGAYSFYNEETTKGELGSISLKGCFSIGEDTYPINENDFNYIATKDQALLDGVISSSSLDNIDKDGLYPLKGSKADIKVKSDIYKEWSPFLNEYKKTLSIGKNESLKESNQLNLVPFIIAGSVGLVLIVVIALLIVKNKKRATPVVQTAAPEGESSEETIDRRKEYFDSLTDREKTIVRLMIACKKRKEIADELNYSENTIKKDLTSIYSKLHVNDKFELMSQYKDIVD